MPIVEQGAVYKEKGNGHLYEVYFLAKNSELSTKQNEVWNVNYRSLSRIENKRVVQGTINKNSTVEQIAQFIPFEEKVNFSDKVYARTEETFLEKFDLVITADQVAEFDLNNQNPTNEDDEYEEELEDDDDDDYNENYDDDEEEEDEDIGYDDDDDNTNKNLAKNEAPPVLPQVAGTPSYKMVPTNEAKQNEAKQEVVDLTGKVEVVGDKSLVLNLDGQKVTINFE
jgi:hypothetical protein